MHRRLLWIALALGGCVAIPDGEHDVADSDDARIDEVIDEAEQDAHDDASSRDDETPLVAYLRARREFAASVEWDLPKGREGRRALRIIVRECRRGEDAAASELESGSFGVATFGLPADCYSHVAYEASRRYNIQHYWMGCVMDDHNMPFAACYNHVMDRAITQAHGPTVLDDLRRELCPRPRVSPPDSD